MNRGFTLIEILISITLLALLMIYVYRIMDNSITRKDEVLTEDKAYLQVETALSRFNWDFKQIYSPLYYSKKFNPAILYPSAQGEETYNPNKSYTNNFRFQFANSHSVPVPLFRSPEDSTFEFFTYSNRRKVMNTKESPFAWVRYSLKPSEKKKDLFRLIREFSPYDPFSSEEEFEKSKGYILLDNIKSLQFLFWDPQAKKFTDRFNQIKDASALIRGVQINLIWVDHLGYETPFIRSFRPLWPEFEAEDLSKFVKPKTLPKPPGATQTTPQGSATSGAENE